MRSFVSGGLRQLAVWMKYHRKSGAQGMFRIKVIAASLIFSVVALVCVGAEQTVSYAKPDTVVTEIGKYKQWNRITKKPILVGVNAARFG